MEAIVFFSLGYFFASLLRPAGSYLKNPDRILKWDSSVFAWRPVLQSATVDEDETILFAYEMKKSDIRVYDEER